jgi:hypothetical protein
VAVKDSVMRYATICGGRPGFLSLANDAVRGEPPQIVVVAVSA